jgi:hypothetical protein
VEQRKRNRHEWTQHEEVNVLADIAASQVPDQLKEPYPSDLDKHFHYRIRAYLSDNSPGRLEYLQITDDPSTMDVYNTEQARSQPCTIPKGTNENQCTNTQS